MHGQRLMPPVIVQYCEPAHQWQAWFDRNPCVAYGGEFSMQAVHRLLECHGTPPGDIELHIDQTGTHPLIQGATWQPPDLLLKCEHCNSTGKYVGLATVEECQRCAGRGFTVG